MIKSAAGTAAALMIVLGISGLAQGTHPGIASAQAYLDAVWAAADAPGGFATAVVLDGEVVLERFCGMASEELGVPISSSTVFGFASVAKQVTGFAVATLAEQGLLAPSDDVRRHLPELPDLGVTITIRTLLDHTSGVRDWVSLAKLSGHSE